MAIRVLIILLGGLLLGFVNHAARAQVNCSGGLAANCTAADIAQATASATGGNSSATGGSVGNISNNGGTHTQTNLQTNTQTAVQTSTSINTAAQQQGQIGINKQGQAQQANNNGNNWSYTNVQPDELHTTGFAPTIYANPTAPCRIAVGVSAGWFGGAAGVTSSVLDEGCDTGRDVTLLQQMNQPEAALARACQKKELAKALGNKCKPEVKAELPAEKVVLKDGSGKPLQNGRY